MTQKEIDRIWSQTALNEINLDRMQSNQGWTLSTLAQYLGVSKSMAERLKQNFIPSRDNMEKYLHRLKNHQQHYHVREAIKAADEAINGLKAAEEYKEISEVAQEVVEKCEKKKDIISEHFGEAEELDDEIKTKIELKPCRTFEQIDHETGRKTSVTIFRLFGKVEEHEFINFAILRKGSFEVYKTFEAACKMAFTVYLNDGGDEIESAD